MAKGRKAGGRKKGTPNRVAASAREAIGGLVEGNVRQLQAWLDSVYEREGALAAFNCFVKILEFHVPKLARTQISSPDGVALNLAVFLSDDPRASA